MHFLTVLWLACLTTEGKSYAIKCSSFSLKIHSKEFEASQINLYLEINLPSRNLYLASRKVLTPTEMKENNRKCMRGPIRNSRYFYP